jgi:hypothetical protein
MSACGVRVGGVRVQSTEDLRPRKHAVAKSRLRALSLTRAPPQSRLAALFRDVPTRRARLDEVQVGGLVPRQALQAGQALQEGVVQVVQHQHREPRLQKGQRGVGPYRARARIRADVRVCVVVVVVVGGL